MFPRTVGYLVFDDLPQPGFWVGVILILAATNWIFLQCRAA
jgi:hypothetical protein